MIAGDRLAGQAGELPGGEQLVRVHHIDQVVWDPARSARGSLAVPMSKWRKTCRESQLTISPLNSRSDCLGPDRFCPNPVGPTTATSGSSAASADRGATVSPEVEVFYRGAQGFTSACPEAPLYNKKVISSLSLGPPGHWRSKESINS